MAVSAGTRVVYNGVTLNNVTTRQWNEEIVRDPSNTDVIFKRFKLEFEAYVHTGSNGENGPCVLANVGGGDATASMVVIRKLLQAPRCELKVYCDNVVLLECVPTTQGTLQNGDRDVNQGPFPTSFQIVRNAGGTCYKVLFAIECCKLECPNASPGGGGMPDLISNRWSVAEDMDDHFFMTKIYRGRIRLSQNVTIDPHWVKAILIPPLENGFRRMRVSLLADPNGLEAAYEIVDRQVDTAAPWPAASINGTHTYQTDNGMNFWAECRVRLEGAAGASRADLITRAMQVVDSRLNLLGRPFLEQSGEKNGWCFDGGGAAVTVHFGDILAVEVYAKIREFPGTEDENTYFYQTVPKNLTKKLTLESLNGEPQAYDPANSWVPPPWGYVPQQGSETARSHTVEFAKRCLAQDPCGTMRNLAQTDNTLQRTNYRGDGVPPITSESYGQIPEKYASPPPIIRDGAKQSIYTYCTMEGKYVTHSNKIQLPKASSSGYTAGQESNKDTCFVGQVAQPTCYRVLELDAERVGQWPEVPPPLETYSDGDLTGTLIDTKIRPHPPVPAADGARGIYRLAVTYIYALNRPPTLTESVRIGTPPTLKYGAGDSQVLFNPTKAFHASLGP